VPTSETADPAGHRRPTSAEPLCDSHRGTQGSSQMPMAHRTPRSSVSGGWDPPTPASQFLTLTERHVEADESGENPLKRRLSSDADQGLPSACGSEEVRTNLAAVGA
jgi:hypothetical protein